MGSQRVGHDWLSDWTDLETYSTILYILHAFIHILYLLKMLRNKYYILHFKFTYRIATAWEFLWSGYRAVILICRLPDGFLQSETMGEWKGARGCWEPWRVSLRSVIGWLELVDMYTTFLVISNAHEIQKFKAITKLVHTNFWRTHWLQFNLLLFNKKQTRSWVLHEVYFTIKNANWKKPDFMHHLVDIKFIFNDLLIYNDSIKNYTMLESHIL